MNDEIPAHIRQKFDRKNKERWFHTVLRYRMDKAMLTYRELRDHLNSLTEEQLSQEVMALPSIGGEKVGLQPVISIGTIEELCHVKGEISTETRSTKDNEHHPEQVVILIDSSPFDEEGNFFYELEEKDGNIIFRGNKTGKEYDIDGKEI